MSKEEPKEIDLEQELDALYRKVASPDRTEDISYPAPSSITETSESEKPEIQDRTDAHPADNKEKATFRISRNMSGVGFFILVIGLTAAFFWPTIYHYDAFNSGGKVYPLRIHRLTGEASYFDGNDWSRPPLPAPVRKPVPENPAVQSAAVVPPDVNHLKAGTVASPTVPAPAKTQSETGYAIQIRAFPESEKEKAVAFVEDVKKRMPDIRMETVQVPGRGVWHRILLGNFASTEEASGNMKKRKLPNAYPGSFIQKKSGG